MSEPDDLAALRAERDALARRAEAAEKRAARLDSDLAEARTQLRHHEETATDGLSLFEGGDDRGGSVVGDGSDSRALPLVLGATAIVAAMVTLLAFLNDNLFTWFGLGMAALTAGLAYAAATTRVQPVTVQLRNGIVYIEQGDTKYRFDLRHDGTRIEQHGRPGDGSWGITFARRHTGPFTVDASMVDPAAFAADVERYRRPSTGS